MFKYVWNEQYHPSVNQLKDLLKENERSILLDVRAKEEFQAGHIPGSLNIPLDILHDRLLKLNKNVPIITICERGNRSETAMILLQENEFATVYNGGSWYDFR